MSLSFQYLVEFLVATLTLVHKTRRFLLESWSPISSPRYKKLKATSSPCSNNFCALVCGGGPPLGGPPGPAPGGGPPPCGGPPCGGPPCGGGPPGLPVVGTTEVGGPLSCGEDRRCVLFRVPLAAMEALVENASVAWKIVALQERKSKSVSVVDTLVCIMVSICCVESVWSLKKVDML